MQRTVIEIDEDKCDGCGICVDACHEGAIAMIDGKARLVSDIYCDGLGDCIGECPQGAITKVVREAADYDETAVEERLKALGRPPLKQANGHAVHAPAMAAPPAHGGGCPGAALRNLRPSPAADAPSAPARGGRPTVNRLQQWPVQLRLVPPGAPFLVDQDLLICADCVPFAVPDFHERYLKNHAVVVACPKLDPADQNLQRLQALLAHTRLNSVTVLRMEVPCCGGLAQQTVQAWRAFQPDIPCEVHTIGIQSGIQITPASCAP